MDRRVPARQLCQADASGEDLPQSGQPVPPHIHLIQLPPYCPHLNPIERLWAVMHQHVTHNRAYPTQKLFTEAILKFLRKIIPEQWHNFRNQVTDNFHIISDQNLRVLE
ncbi:putative transposase (plasmid) [Octadecabacter arcticus 238]|uniref:Putative transposase n=1 Tax=Octadecabacter arcticus 238 TaxID=391616 RepID=M9RQ73_9RHOB|nr:putative transposase [Octadecabacter arcticus 238]